MRTAILLGLFLNAMAMDSGVRILTDVRSINFILWIIFVMMVMDVADFIKNQKKIRLTNAPPRTIRS